MYFVAYDLVNTYILATGPPRHSKLQYLQKNEKQQSRIAFTKIYVQEAVENQNYKVFVYYFEYYNKIFTAHPKNSHGRTIIRQAIAALA